MPACLLLALALAAPAATASAAAPPPTLSAGPARIYIEEWPQRRDLNFELFVDNGGGPARELTAIELAAYDARGRLQLRRLLDGNGVRPSIQTVPERQLPAGGKLTVFNPFASFAREQALARLHYTLRFQGPEGTPETVAELDVRPQARAAATALRLPLAGPVLNYDGHDFYAHHRRFDTSFAPIAALGFRGNFMRYAYDFVPVDAQGESHSGEGADNAQWTGFGAPVLAAGDGTVVALAEDKPDDRHFDESKLADTPMVLFGNYLVIDHGNGEFSVYGHLQQGSVLPAVGARVHRGEPIARIGASGSAMFPHLHFELQDGPDLRAEGLPSYFEGIRSWPADAPAAAALRSVDTGELVRGD
jgi:murein DD-endopeptidase MepM/ murein hydrolase activator NlpD